jgi:hypothetical protein
MTHIVEPDPPGVGCINEAVEDARHCVGVWTLTILPDEQPATRRLSGAEGVPFDVKSARRRRRDVGLVG